MSQTQPRLERKTRARPGYSKKKQDCIRTCEYHVNNSSSGNSVLKRSKKLKLRRKPSSSSSSSPTEDVHCSPSSCQSCEWVCSKSGDGSWTPEEIKMERTKLKLNINSAPIIKTAAEAAANSVSVTSLAAFNYFKQNKKKASLSSPASSSTSPSISYLEYQRTKMINISLIYTKYGRESKKDNRTRWRNIRKKDVIKKIFI